MTLAAPDLNSGAKHSDMSRLKHTSGKTSLWRIPSKGYITKPSRTWNASRVISVRVQCKQPVRCSLDQFVQSYQFKVVELRSTYLERLEVSDIRTILTLPDRIDSSRSFNDDESECFSYDEHNAKFHREVYMVLE